MPKFFSSNIVGNTIKIESEDAHHIRKVLRLKVGESILVCDGKGFDYHSVISEINENEILCEILSKIRAETEPNLEVTLYQALPKASKMDYIIQKNTELGVTRIVPCVLNRCVVKLENKKAEEKKRERWQKIAYEAAKQSGRGVVPEVLMPCALDEIIVKMKAENLAFALYECETDRNLKSVLTQDVKAEKVGFLIGPEGGFDPLEIEKLKAAGIPPVGLGKRILRTETAGEAVLSMVMYEIGDINN